MWLIKLGDEGLEKVIKCATGIQVLKAKGCKGVTDQFLENLAKFCQKLTVLELTAEQLTDKGRKLVCESDN